MPGGLLECEVIADKLTQDLKVVPLIHFADVTK